MVRLDIRLTFTSGGYADECEGLELEDADAFASGSFFAADFMDVYRLSRKKRHRRSCARNGSSCWQIWIEVTSWLSLSSAMQYKGYVNYPLCSSIAVSRLFV